MTSAITFPPVRVSDPHAFGRVAVLYGGESSEREVSLSSFATVIAALQDRGVDAVGVDGVAELLNGIAGHEYARVFNIMHGGSGENGVVQGLLEAAGIPYTGSGVLGSALTMDKIRTKQVWLSLGLPTPAYARVESGADVAAAAGKLGLPVIVKPALEGSSVGVSRVFREQDLAPALALASRYGRELLMERLIEGDEYTVGILDGVAMPSIRIVPPGEYYDYHAKYVSDDTQYLCPGLDPAADREMGALALSAFVASGASGWGRVDIMRDRAGRDWLLEVNTTPGMTSHSLVPKAARAAGLDIGDLVWRILETSLPNRAQAGPQS